MTPRGDKIVAGTVTVLCVIAIMVCLYVGPIR